jgi:hypothetical protein
MAGTSGDSSRRVSGILFGPRGILFRGIQDSLRTQGLAKNGPKRAYLGPLDHECCIAPKAYQPSPGPMAETQTWA